MCFPVQGEAEIVAVHKRFRFIQSNLGSGKKLPSDVCRGDSVGVPYFDIQSVRMTEAFHCQMKSDQPGKHQRSASADADQIIKQAEAYRESKINEAEGQAARFTELFAEYQNYPLITKQRLFYEAMEEILPDMKLYIVDANTGVQTALPLESFANVNMGTTEGGAAN